MNNTKIIYIAGYGRSGSTYLEAELSRGNTYSLGEISFFSRFNSERSYLKPELFLENIRLISEDDYHLFNSRKYDSVFGVLCDRSKYLFSLSNFIRNIKTEYVIDGSKSTLYAIRRINSYIVCGFDVDIIHLKRSKIELFKRLLLGKNSDLETSTKRIAIIRFTQAILGTLHAVITDILTHLCYSNHNNYTVLRTENIDQWLRENGGKYSVGRGKRSYGLGGNRLIRR